MLAKYPAIIQKCPEVKKTLNGFCSDSAEDDGSDDNAVSQAVDGMFFSSADDVSSAELMVLLIAPSSVRQLLL